jgi:hypothetical protein
MTDVSLPIGTSIVPGTFPVDVSQRSRKTTDDDGPNRSRTVGTLPKKLTVSANHRRNTVEEADRAHGRGRRPTMTQRITGTPSRKTTDGGRGAAR